MDGKQIGSAITLILLIPTLIALISLSIKTHEDPGNLKNVEEGVNIAVDEAIPWWLGIFQWLAGLGLFGAILIIAFVLFLKWIGEVR